MTPKEKLVWQLRVCGLAVPDPEYRFHPDRRWRFDWAWPDRMLAVEYEGVFSGGKSRHLTIGGFKRDADKYLCAAEAGWTVLRVTADQVRSGLAARAIEACYRRLTPKKAA